MIVINIPNFIISLFESEHIPFNAQLTLSIIPHKSDLLRRSNLDSFPIPYNAENNRVPFYFLSKVTGADTDASIAVNIVYLVESS